MDIFRQRKKELPFYYKTPFLIIFSFIIILIMRSSFISYQRRIAIGKEAEKMEQEYERLKKELDLKRERNRLFEDDEGILLELKKRYSLDEPGVRVILLTEKEE